MQIYALLTNYLPTEKILTYPMVTTQKCLSAAQQQQQQTFCQSRVWADNRTTLHL